MSLIDRYTVLKWKEICKSFAGNFTGYLFRLYALCNATTTTRLVSLGFILAIVLLITGLVSILQPESPVPMAKRLILKEIDDQGDTWSLDYLKNQDIQTILSGPVKPGQPLTLTMRFLRKGSILSMKPDIAGAAGEKYFPGILKNGQWQEAPKVIITDNHNKQLHQGQFEYG